LEKTNEIAIFIQTIVNNYLNNYTNFIELEA